MSEGVEVAVHVCTVLAFVPDDEPGLPGSALAEFHGVSPSYLAKTMQALVRGGVCVSEPGRTGGYRLARPADQLTLLDVTSAVEGDEAAFRCQEVRQRGPAAVDDSPSYRRPCSIASAFWAAEDAWRASLRATSIAEICAGLAQQVDPVQLATGAEWLASVSIRRQGVQP